MQIWQRNTTRLIAASLAGAVLCAYTPTTGHAQFLGLQKFLGNKDSSSGSPAAESSQRRGWGWFRRGDTDQDGNDPFKAQWVTNPRPGFPTLSSQNIELTRQTVEQYENIVARGGWPRVPELALKPGSRGQAVITLHQRLEISGDLVGTSVPNVYDEAVTRAVQKFQVRHGLPPTGVLDRPTVDAMNVPASVRLQQLKASLTRLRKLAPKAHGRYVIVNIPAAQSEAVDNGQVVDRYTVVVGKANLATPTLESKIMQISFNPYWNVPRSIVRNDLVPKARELQARGVDMLATYRMQAIDGSGQILGPGQVDWYSDAVYGYRFRQLPWEENSLGFVKIDFPNRHAVYMHDTPEKAIFSQELRYESHGCVRVHNVSNLVAWLLQDNPGWDINRIQQMKMTGEQQIVKLKRPVPVMFIYVSAWTTPDGMANFRPDIYQVDTTSTTASAY
ncbi:L,D-transpeptidase family protein [Methyloligella sp. 2.7D]|uniref:L,D-transpeptidase family protein n=1 Tax=unclassified Methyloligella TaxID=2625955 RepID=UPI00157CD814|nr:L,D-transpeptidase family protein [Methyloligella sp. GL2]QKP77601.1 L,D-transpeptidase family protein [Methyloligella sp. GL2]